MEILSTQALMAPAVIVVCGNSGKDQEGRRWRETAEPVKKEWEECGKLHHKWHNA